MLTSLALCLAPVLASQDAADLHLADSGLYLDVPDLPAFAEAWRSGAIMGMLEDQELVELLAQFGIEHASDLLELLPAEVRSDMLPIVAGIEGLSLSLKLDLSNVSELIAEGAVVYEVMTELEALNWELTTYEWSHDGPPASLAELGLDPVELLDPFGNTYAYGVMNDVYELTSLGADGEVGGAGLDADWNVEASFEKYVLARIFEVVGVELAVKWVDDEFADDMGAIVGMIDGRIRGEVPFTEILDLNGPDESLANLYRIDPATMGMPSSGGLLEASLQQHGRTFVMTMGTISGRAVHELGRAATSGQPSPEALGSVGHLDHLIGQVHSDEGAVLWQGAVLGFQGVPTEGMLADSLANVASLFEFFGFYGKDSAWQTRLVDGTYVSDSTRPAKGLAPHSLDGSAAWIPNDAIFAQVTSLDPRSFWDYVTEVTEGEEELLEILAARGVHIERDLIANLGGELAFWMQPVRSLAPPQVYGVLPVTDGEAVMGTLDGLSDFLAELEIDLGVSHRPYRGTNYTVLDVGIPIGLSPSYTVIDGNLWFSNSSTLIKRMIRQSSKGEDYERGAHPFFVSLQGADGKLASDIHDAFYFDVGSMLAAYYGTGRAFAGMIPSELGLPAGFVAALPEPDIFERHFHPETTVTRFLGDRLVTHKETSFGPEIPLLAGGALGLVLPKLAVMVEPSGPAEILWVEPEFGLEQHREVEHSDHVHGVAKTIEVLTTEGNLASLDIALLIYNLENADYPTKLEGLVAATSSYPEGYLNMSELPVDGWGQAFVFERVSSSEYRLRSIGPNGVDEAGAGDDLTP